MYRKPGWILVSGKMFADLTSVGCHTNLWNFETKTYHDWVAREDILEKMLPIATSDKAVIAKLNNQTIKCGIGIHDSSAALIPYLVNFKVSGNCIMVLRDRHSHL